MAILLDGKKCADHIQKEIQEHCKKAAPKQPGLAVILIGDDPASQVYVHHKIKMSKGVGFYSQIHRLSPDISEAKVLSLIEKLNDDPAIHGILLQLPLPKHLDPHKMMLNLNPDKDVDGFHPLNLGKLMTDAPTFIPCTPKGILRLLKEYKIPISGKKVVIVGRSLIVGKPLAHLFLKENATVTICHSKTMDIPHETRQADILVSAVGKPHWIHKDDIKPGATIIDVGINRIQKKLVGDIDFERVSAIAHHITPVPGGVGPMTVAMLLENTWLAFSNSRKIK